MSRSNKPVNPAAEQALERLKNETAAELGLTNYQNTYKGALTSADNGRVGGHMVRKMIESQEQQFSQQSQTGQASKTGQTMTQKNNINS